MFAVYDGYLIYRNGIDGSRLTGSAVELRQPILHRHFCRPDHDKCHVQQEQTDYNDIMAANSDTKFHERPREQRELSYRGQNCHRPKIADIAGWLRFRP